MDHAPAEPPPTTPTPPVTSHVPTVHATVGTGGVTSGAGSVAMQDLSGDKLILSAPRAPFNGGSVPSLGGIPLLARLGQGGMGAVYFGIHPRLRQEVAVKVLPFELAEKNPGAIQRFQREAQLAARVKSPHLVGVMDVNQESGLTYLVMEYVAGVSAQAHLREVIKTVAPGDSGRAGLHEAVALDICIAACTGLAAAHAKGIIHRDVKPDNILIPRDENTGALQFHAAKLADLGLARSEAIELSSLTLKDAGMGTPGYMPPEQFADAKSCRKPADVFAMGATLYALLTGWAPFAGTQLYAILKATIESPHAPIRKLRPDISAPTAEFLDRCLAKDPAQRYVDGSALLAALGVCRDALAQPEQTRAAVARVSGLLRATEVGQTVVDTVTPPVPQASRLPVSENAGGTPAVRAPRAFRAAIWAAFLLLAFGGAVTWYAFNSGWLSGAIAGGPGTAAANTVNKGTSELQAQLDAEKQEQARKIEAAAAQERARKKEDAEKLAADEAKNKLETARKTRDENRQALANAIPLAVEAKRREDWAQIVKLLEAKRALPDNADNPNNDAADALLAEAKSELKKKRADFDAKLADAKRIAALFETNAVAQYEAEAVINAALAIKPNDAEATALLEKLGPTQKDLTLDLGAGVNLDLVLIKSGTFEMGSPADEKDRYDNEKQHTVTINRDFYMAKYPVTQEQYAAVMNTNPSYFTLDKGGGPKNPVEHVSWNDAVEFCEKLDGMLKAKIPRGMKLQLPTETQWEYACRAGTKTRFYSGDADSDLDGVAWYSSNSDSKTHPVGLKTSNAFRLYDMHGNVWQWCRDVYRSDYENLGAKDSINKTDGTARVLRGGAWISIPRCCRSAFRFNFTPDFRNYSYGFRVVVTFLDK